MKKYILLTVISWGLCCGRSIAQNIAEAKKQVTIGAYYFDGWTGTYPYHITKLLTDSFSEREPTWGWITSTQEIVDKQIELAASSGIDFFSFCWYNKPNYKNEPLNHALSLFLKSKNKVKLKFCLMVANHAGSEVGPEDWPFLMKDWTELFKDSQYQTVDGKPLLIFFSIQTLINKFGSANNVKIAFEQLKSYAIKDSLPGITIAACTGPAPQSLQQAEECGFDILTGYNYHAIGFNYHVIKVLPPIHGARQVPITNMQIGEKIIWNMFHLTSKLPLIPVVTLNWDPRPWATPNNGYGTAPYFTGFSEKSVFNSIKGAMEWVNENKVFTSKERIVMLYAWNEYGEGAYLTPSKNGDNFLKGLKEALGKRE